LGRIHSLQYWEDENPESPRLPKVLKRTCSFYFYRDELDREFPTTNTTNANVSDDVLAHAKSGPAPTGNWKAWVVYELARIAVAEEAKPSNAKLAEFCELKTGYQPSLSDIGNLVRALRQLL
jgi:hypothetical protein